MEDLKNSYLNEQGLRQERDALRIENARLRRALMTAECIIDSHIGDIEDGNRESSKDYTSPEYLALLRKGQAECNAALEMSGGVK